MIRQATIAYNDLKQEQVLMIVWARGGHNRGNEPQDPACCVDTMVTKKINANKLVKNNQSLTQISSTILLIR